MNSNAEKLIKEAINLLTQAISCEEDTCEKVDTEKSPVKTATAKKSVPANDAEWTEESLAELSYNDLKKLCKELNISAVGARDTLVDKILNRDTAEGVEDENDVSEEAEVEEPKKKAPAKSAPSKKVIKNPEPVEEEPDEDDSEDTDEEEEESTLSIVLEATEDMTDEEIADLLTENGISAKGKRQALIDKLVKAVDEGIIPIEDEEDEESDDTEEELTPANDTKKSKTTAKNEAEVEEESAEEIEENPDMTKFSKKRKTAFDKKAKEVRTAFNNGKLKMKSIKSALTNYYGDDIDFSELDEEDLLSAYLDILSLSIDDDGDIHETEDAYTINDNVYCCGHLCNINDDGDYECSECGSVYSSEDEG